MSFQGAIFDVDGVLVDSPHQQAWRADDENLLAAEHADLVVTSLDDVDLDLDALADRRLSRRPT